MPSATKQATYTDVVLPGGSKVPVAWWFQLRDKQGNQVGAEQVYAEPVAEVTVSAGPGTYLVRGGQRDDTGAELGVAIESAPFDFAADLTVKMLSAIG